MHITLVDYCWEISKIQLSQFRSAHYHFTLPDSVDKEMRNAFEKLNVLDEQPCSDKNSESSELNTFTLQILAAIDHNKNINHKRPNVIQFLAILKN